MKDLHNKIEVVSLLDPIAVSTTQTITDIDLAGWNSAELIFAIGLVQVPVCPVLTRSFSCFPTVTTARPIPPLKMQTCSV
jgi:hypothetical protein